MSQAVDVLACAPGTALGTGWRPREPRPARAAGPATPAEVEAAFAAVADRLAGLAESFRRDGAAEHADLLDAEALIARDPTFSAEVNAALAADDERDAERALAAASDRLAAVMESLGSADLRERAADIRHIGRLVSDQLAGRAAAVPPPGPVVLLDDEVAAPDLLDHADRVVAAVSARGGPSSHASIVARSLGIPLVVGADAAALALAAGRPVLVDASAGCVVVDPTPAEAVVAAAPAPVLGRRSGRPRTLDGAGLTVLANVASAAEARRGLDAGASGVGLLRTELPFLAARAWPTEAEHRDRLAPVLEVLRGHPVTVRLLDFGTDKTPPFLADAAGSSLTRLLGAPGALESQLRAVLRAGRGQDLRLLVPMVRTAAELAEVRHRLAAAAADVGATQVPPVGAMVELPEAVAEMASLAPYADFFSLGTNDLTAAALGLARTDPQVGPGSVREPAVLRLVGAAVRHARAAERPLSLCGDAAGEPGVLALLVGAGIRSVSVAPTRVAAVLAALDDLSAAECAARYRAAVGEPAGPVDAALSVAAGSDHG